MDYEYGSALCFKMKPDFEKSHESFIILVNKIEKEIGMPDKTIWNQFLFSWADPDFQTCIKFRKDSILDESIKERIVSLFSAHFE